MFFTSIIMIPSAIYLILGFAAAGEYAGRVVGETTAPGNGTIPIYGTFDGIFFGYQQGSLKPIISFSILISFLLSLLLYWINVCFGSTTLKRLLQKAMSPTRTFYETSPTPRPTPASLLEEYLSAEYKVFVVRGESDDGRTPEMKWKVTLTLNPSNPENVEKIRKKLSLFSSQGDECVIRMLLKNDNMVFGDSAKMLNNLSRFFLNNTHKFGRAPIRVKSIGYWPETTPLSERDNRDWFEAKEFECQGGGKTPIKSYLVWYWISAIFGLSCCFRTCISDKKLVSETICITRIVAPKFDVQPLAYSSQLTEEEVMNAKYVDEEESKEESEVFTRTDFSSMQKVSHSDVKSIKPTDEVVEVYVEEEAQVMADGSLRWVPVDHVVEESRGYQVVENDSKMVVPDEDEVMGRELKSERGITIRAGTRIVEGSNSDSDSDESSFPRIPQQRDSSYYWNRLQESWADAFSFLQMYIQARLLEGAEASHAPVQLMGLKQDDFASDVLVSSSSTTPARVQSPPAPPPPPIIQDPYALVDCHEDSDEDDDEEESETDTDSDDEDMFHDWSTMGKMTNESDSADDEEGTDTDSDDEDPNAHLLPNCASDPDDISMASEGTTGGGSRDVLMSCDESFEDEDAHEA